jgi:hypothetical protein
MVFAGSRSQAQFQSSSTSTPLHCGQTLHRVTKAAPLASFTHKGTSVQHAINNALRVILP